MLPLLLVAHAIVFWGRGLLDEEGMAYIQRYLANKPLLALIFDPNDTTLYQAREISYLFDIADARILAWIVDHVGVIFIPASGALGLVAVALIYLRGARKTLQLEAATSSLVLSLFLSCIVTQASTAIFYRSAKMVLSVALFAFVFYLASLFRKGSEPGGLTRRRLSMLFVLGLAMSLTDRQGLFYLLTATLCLALLTAVSWLRRDGRAGARLRLTTAGVGAVVAAVLYSVVIAPRLIDWTGGAGVTYTNQRQSLADFNWTLVSYGFEIFRGQVRYLFGNLPFVVTASVALAAAAFAVWRQRSHEGRAGRRMTIDVLIVAVVVPAALIMLLAGMVLYHRPIYTIPDHTMWYYTLTVPAVLMLALTLLLATVDLARLPFVKHAIHIVLVAMIASNVLHYREQRHAMTQSRYIGEQYARTQQILGNERAVRTGRIAPSQRPWLRVEPSGAVVTLPVADEAFQEEIRAAYATLRHRPPLDEAPGPYWARVYEFLSNSPALLEEPQDLAALVDGLRSVGVHRIELSQRTDDNRPMTDAIRATGQTTKETASGDIVAFDLAAPVPRVNVGPLREVPANAFHATASNNQDGLARALDGNTATYWSTDAAQAGHEWIRIAFDRPIDVGCVRLFFVAGNPGRNLPGTLTPAVRQGLFKEAFRPRGLTIEAEGDGTAASATPFNPLGALIEALLRDPVRPTMEFCLAPNRSRALTLRQTGRSATDPWNVAELTIWERK